jgi:DNA polymerase-3 subunit epsilon
LINPETRFVTKFRKPIEFNIDEKALKKEKNFRDSYSALKALFSQDALFIAHSINNDIRMLNLACKRYNMPSFKFKFICSQMLYSIFSDTADGIGLDIAAEKIGEEFKHHMADEDALMSLKLVKYICGMKGLTLSELLDEYGVNYGSLRNFEIRLMHSKSLDEQRLKRKEERKKEQDEKNALKAQTKVENV